MGEGKGKPTKRKLAAVSLPGNRWTAKIFKRKLAKYCFSKGKDEQEKHRGSSPVHTRGSSPVHTAHLPCAHSNNMAERTVKPFVIGRKNWLFSTSPKGAQASAIIYSVMNIAYASGRDVKEYLNAVFHGTDKPLLS